MKIDANIYRVRSNNQQINEILNYDFSEYDNSSIMKVDEEGNFKDTPNPLFWRNIVKDNYDADQYSAFYKEQIDKLITILGDDSQYLPMTPIPIGQYINSYTKNQTLNTVSKIQNITFNGIIQDELVSNNSSDFLILQEGIRDNDLIVIKEDGKVVLIGFAINFDNEDREYGKFKLQSVEIGNIGYLYDITKVAVNQSIAAYSMNGQDVQNLDVPVMENLFSGQSVFQIIDTCFNDFFYAISDIDANISNRKNYYFSISRFINSFIRSTASTPATFGTIFTMLKTLQMYIQYENPIAKSSIVEPNANDYPMKNNDPAFISAMQKYQSESHGVNNNLDFTFKWATVDHGEHQTYNAMVASSFQMFIPTFKTINAIFDDIIKNSMYNFHIGYDGCLHVHPPVYNYLPLEMLIYNSELLNWSFNKEHKNYIKYDETISDDYESKNSDLMTRTDAKYMFPFVGEIEYFPAFYIDIKALAKFGFRQNEPYSNPNATVPSLAKLLAMMLNITENSMTRKITLRLKTELIEEYKMTPNRFEVGQLYVIEKPENKGKFVGYLLDIDEDIKVDSYPTVSLTFSYLRNIEEFVQVTAGNIDDILAIYNKYGIFDTLQASPTIDATSFNNSYDEYKKKFLNDIHENKDFSVGITMPAFKTFPTILDFIQLTYTDEKTQEATAKSINQAKETPQSNTTVLVQGSMYYQSFLIKMQRFFDITNNNTGTNGEINADILSGNNKYYNYQYLTLNPQIPTDDKWYNNSYKTFIQKNKTIKHQGFSYTLYDNKNNLNIANFQTNFQTSWLGYITQELFNRIIECDADFQDKSGSYSLTDWYNGPPISFYTKLLDLHPYYDANEYSDMSQNVITSSSLKNWIYKQGLNLTWQQTMDSSGKLFYPQQIVNMDFLQQNIVLGLATSEDKQTMIGKTEMQSNLFQAHLDGRAIDIVVPEEGTSTCLYLNTNWLNINTAGEVLNTITYNHEFYNYIENIFKRHFDIIKVHNNVLLDLTKLNIKFPKQANPTQYKARIYHLEVSNMKYLQLQNELFSTGDATNSIVRLS